MDSHNGLKVGDIVVCVRGFPAVGTWGGLKEGETYIVRELRDDCEDVYLEGVKSSWMADRFVKSTPLNTPVLYDHSTGETTPLPVRNTQIGGAHYHEMKIQPYEYSLANNLGPLEHTAIKYVSRWRKKNGVEDLKKAIHTIQYLIEYTDKNGMPE